MSIATYSKTGAKSNTPAKLDKNVFGVKEINPELIKAAYQAYLANGRDNLAQVKTRAEVRGGGRKPWKQKGTGRARFGSSRNPIWRGGGITFGPTGEENYAHKLHVTAKRNAIRQALSLAAANDKVAVIEDLKFKDNKTAEAAKLLSKIGASKNVLLVVADKTAELQRATSNLSGVKLVQARYVNVFDVINADKIVITNDALKVISDWLSNDTKKGPSTSLRVKGNK